MKREEELEYLLKDACDRVERSTVWGAAEALGDLLASEMDIPRDTAKISWLDLHRIVLAAARERSWPSAGYHLVNLLRLRKEREAYLTIILNDAELHLYQKIENRSPRELGPFIANNYTCELAGANLPKFLLKQQTWSSLLNFVRGFQPTGISDANTLYSVLLTTQSLQKWKPRNVTSLFCRCSLCWRPVPARFMGKKERILCQFHTYLPCETMPAHKKAYERALKIDKAGSVGKKVKPVADALYALTQVSADCRESLANWIGIWDSDPCAAQSSLPCEVAWPNAEQLSSLLPAIAEVMPIIANTASIIESLAPVHPRANTDERNGMLALHAMWCKNFFLFVPELARAESWLRQCKFVHGKMYFPG
ncbi:hypothetical protein [Desulfovibrio cuneatus]|uniref:hypothetical protein n=1 Tax=Desulfovibrio cuneatus TaxID=159728 RepID=UPI00040C5C9C|nr:hypothetical protein [Desulfovibrio cuneatus]